MVMGKTFPAVCRELLMAACDAYNFGTIEPESACTAAVQHCHT